MIEKPPSLWKIPSLIAGFAFVGLGFLGAVVPGLPATIFFILAAWSFSNSHPKLEAWVLNLPGFGPLVRDYRAGLGMRRKVKGVAIGSCVVMSMVSIFVVPVVWVKVCIGIAAAAGVWFIGWRTPTRAG